MDRLIPATMDSLTDTSAASAGHVWPVQSYLPRRREQSMPTVGTGKYTYTLIQDWAKLPPGESFAMVSAMATDSQDRVYAFQRKDPPIVIFDRDGKYLSSWGNGGFLFAHGIHIANDIVYLTDRDSSVCLMYTLD